MKSDAPVTTASSEAGHGSLSSYVVGFVLSVALTVMAYVFVVHHVFSGAALVAAIVTLAIAQLLVQLAFFLHLGRESKPRWNLTILLFAAIVVVIVVFGSLWIMNNLNYNMMSPHDTDTEIIKDEGYGHSH